MVCTATPVVQVNAYAVLLQFTGDCISVCAYRPRMGDASCALLSHAAQRNGNFLSVRRTFKMYMTCTHAVGIPTGLLQLTSVAVT